jgi:hypothetical protein
VPGERERVESREVANVSVMWGFGGEGEVVVEVVAEGDGDLN